MEEVHALEAVAAGWEAHWQEAQVDTVSAHGAATVRSTKLEAPATRRPAPNADRV
jgi:hypothetical protein